MSISELLRWQWKGYPKYHQSRPNLLIHIVAVPLFLFGTIALVGAIARLSLLLFVVAVGCILVAVALQGRGHRLEPCHRNPSAGRLISYRGFSLSSGLRFHGLFSREVGLQHCARHASPNLVGQHGRPARGASRWRRVAGYLRSLGIMTFESASQLFDVAMLVLNAAGVVCSLTSPYPWHYARRSPPPILLPKCLARLRGVTSRAVRGSCVRSFSGPGSRRLRSLRCMTERPVFCFGDARWRGRSLGLVGFLATWLAFAMRKWRS